MNHTEIAQIITDLHRAAELLRSLGGEEEYDLADACDRAARQIESDQDYADQRGAS